MKIELITFEELKNYVEKEKIERSLNHFHGSDICFLNIDIKEAFKNMLIYGVFLNKTISGFCVTPKNFTGNLSKIYISIKCRNKGLATYSINKLKIKNLHCLKDNEDAFSLYTKLGFKVGNCGLMYLYSVYMERELN